MGRNHSYNIPMGWGPQRAPSFHTSARLQLITIVSTFLLGIISLLPIVLPHNINPTIYISYDKLYNYIIGIYRYLDIDKGGGTTGRRGALTPYFSPRRGSAPLLFVPSLIYYTYFNL